MLRLVTLSSLFPNAYQPGHGIFIENRLRSLLGTGSIGTRVIAPVPWFPSSHPRFGRYAAYARIPRCEERLGVPVLHPRVPIVPGPGYLATPGLMAAAASGPLRRLLRDGWDFDVIDAYYFYPDGIAAALLGAWFERPAVITALGTDVNLIADKPAPRRMIRWAAGRAAGLTTVSRALADRLVDLGIPRARITVIRHGVDLTSFHPPEDRDALRRRLGLTRPTLLAVGNLVELKGHRFMIDALRLLPDADLLIAGTGEEQSSLSARARHLGLAERVRFLGRIDQRDLPDWYGAADLLVMASSREGIPNVLMESLACGTPAVATAVGGIPEIISRPEAGRLVGERRAESLAAGISGLLADPPERTATRLFAEGFRWERTSTIHRGLLDRVAATALHKDAGRHRPWHPG